MNAAEKHYLVCLNEHCERVFCVGRRDYEQKILALESKVKKAEHKSNLIKDEDVVLRWPKIDRSCE